jgi:hypothetical protein
MRYYTYLNANEIDLVNWDWVYESKDTVRWDNYNEHFIVSFNEEYCDEFERLNGIPVMNLETTHILMNSEQWILETDNDLI